jgi:hypothetical protein
MAKTEQDAIHELAAFFSNDNGLDPATLADPADWPTAYRMIVLALQGGASIEDVKRGLSNEELDAFFEPDPDAEPPEPPDFDAVEVPELPRAAQIDPALGIDASPWLDAYTAFSRNWSPRAYDGFHEACALWLLSTVAARRVRCDLGGDRYTNLSIALVARTSLYAKSTTAKIVGGTLAAAGLDWMLAADDATPQKFISDLVRSIPNDYDRLPLDLQERARLRAAFPAQRGWFYEEFGMKLAAMMSSGGFMADFRGILRSFDDCPPRYEYGTISRGSDLVERPYLSLLANMTPADLRGAARKNDAMWNDGFWARFAFVTPPPGANRARARFPDGARIIPSTLTTPLVNWHQRLGVPQVTVDEVVDEESKGKPAPRYEARVIPGDGTGRCELAPDVIEAFYTYHDGLCDLIEATTTPDLDGNYSRFAEKALRVALLLGSLDNSGAVEMRHWARAQTITEGWRAGLHSLYQQVNTPGPSEEAANEDKVMRIAEKLSPCTAAEVGRRIRGMSSRETAFILDGLVAAGALSKTAGRRKGTWRYALIP